MKLTIYTQDNNLTIGIDNERRDLANLLSILDKSLITSLKFSDMISDRLPRRLSEIGAEEIIFERCHALRGIGTELRKCLSLRKISFIKCADFCDLRGISTLSNLEMLSVTGCECIDMIPDETADMGSLEALDLSHCPLLGWIDLTNMPSSLKILDIHGSTGIRFSDEAADKLDLISVSILDYLRIADMQNVPKLENIAERLMRSKCQSSAAYDGSGGDD